RGRKPALPAAGQGVPPLLRRRPVGARRRHRGGGARMGHQHADRARRQDRLRGVCQREPDQALLRRIAGLHISVAGVPIWLRAAHRHRSRAGRRLHVGGRRHHTHRNLRDRQPAQSGRAGL
ncbi:uncharacterized protein METZ01_LOCUS189614, partial [marine metagenome]